LSVDVEHDFAPTYAIPKDKRELVRQIREDASAASVVYLATDPDREGEAIAWHLMEAAGLSEAHVRRVVFHEITRSAIEEAFKNTRAVDMQLVNAQQARRILDRLLGYQISPLLWSRVRSRLSAGRVQSVALRLIVERERSILAFVPVEYWTLAALLAAPATRGEDPRPGFAARLAKVIGGPLDLSRESAARSAVVELDGATYQVSDVRRSERRRRPGAPFTTSTMQQDAASRLGMTAQRAMRIAQELYEGISLGPDGTVGLITYMRTDSVNLAAEAQSEARLLIAADFGPDYVPAEPNSYKSRSKNAQEAHEAIRPTEVHRRPSQLIAYLNRDQYRLYELIWQRFVASQMAAAVYDTVAVEVTADPVPATGRQYVFRSSGFQVRFLGFLKVYAGRAASADGVPTADGAEPSGDVPLAAIVDGDGTESEEERGRAGNDIWRSIPPGLQPGDPLDLLRLVPEQHFTQPPPRFSEASLVRTLEENGIGRPSTYAAIISTLLDREYVARSERRLLPTELGCTVNDLLIKHFDSVFNVGFTAGMEERLDAVARGEADTVSVLRDFYDTFGPQLQAAEQQMEKVPIEPEKTGELCPLCQGELVIKNGRFGRFVGCSNYPQCRFTRPLLVRLGIACPLDGGELVQRDTRSGRVFYGCSNYPECGFRTWKRPSATPCPRCGGLMLAANGDSTTCSVCGFTASGGSGGETAAAPSLQAAVA
jgi:DNA topoisomerase I